MRVHRTPALAVLLVVIALGVMTSAASAETLGIENWERGFRTVWGSLEFRNNVGLETVRCPVTIEGSLHEKVIEKVAGFLVGYVARVSLSEGSCTGGRARVVTEGLPWHYRYNSFTGTLPFITSVHFQLIGARFSVEPTGFGSACNVTSSATNPIGLIAVTRREAGGVLELPTLEADSSASIPLEGGFLCATARGSLAGTGSSTVQGGGARQRLVAGNPGILRIEPESILIRRPNNSGLITLVNIAAPGREPIEIRSIGMSTEIERLFTVDDIERCARAETGTIAAGGGECAFRLSRRLEVTMTTSGTILILYADHWHPNAQIKVRPIRWEQIE